MRVFAWLRWAAVLLAACTSISASADSHREQIDRFVSSIQVLADGSIEVTEEITVTSLGREIRRGIFRDLPTDYRTDDGNRMTVKYEVLLVLRDGELEPYHVERRGEQGIRVYIGHKDHYLSPGVYTYTLSYRTARQLGFFENYDELYWNVTGNDWVFPIIFSRATVRPPEGAQIIQSAGYTGRRGESGQDYELQLNDDGSAVFESTRVLGPGEGLTIAIAWPKGYVEEPTGWTRAGYFFADNASAVAALVGFFVLLIYYLAAWHRFGRDPEQGTVIPRFKPPDGFSPAAIRFVKEMGHDSKGFAAALVSMAVKGFVKIKEDDSGKFSLERLGEDESGLSNGERKLARGFFPIFSSVELEQKNHKQIRKARNAFQSSLEAEYEKAYFVKNRGFFVIGVVVTLLGLIGVAVFSETPTEGVMLGAFSAIWTSIWVFTAYGAIKRLRIAITGGGRYKAARLLAAVVGLAFFIPFASGTGFMMRELMNQIPVMTVVLLIAMVATNIAFFHWMKAPTVAGRKILDEIDGFKRYLSVAEKHRLEKLHPPDETPELFEQYLPYAIALGVEHEWSDRFKATLARAASEPGAAEYSPRWYSGASWNRFQSRDFASALGSSLAVAAASSASAPGSSSGSGGGGSSGGGGGGGGGGGW